MFRIGSGTGFLRSQSRARSEIQPGTPHTSTTDTGALTELSSKPFPICTLAGRPCALRAKSPAGRRVIRQVCKGLPPFEAVLQASHRAAPQALMCRG